MILEQLRLRNFCLFRGKQTFELRPVERKGKHLPIILFGGINGGGKTTLIDAIQLALYGTRARCSKRSNTQYEDFLLHSIHHGVPPEEGASILLSFRYFNDGEEHLYEISRAWQVSAGRLHEDLQVFKDGSPDAWLSEHWPQLVEELVPLEVSQLFFFDAEKIRTLADDESSSRILGTAIKALLGLDIVERLITDATVLQTRLARAGGSPEHRERIEQLQQRSRELQSEIKKELTARAGLENRRLRAEAELKRTEESFAAGGGRHWEQREQRRQSLIHLQTLSTETETQLQELATTELPLALVSTLLYNVNQQATLERTITDAQLINGLLVDRDKQLLDVIRAARTSPKLLRLIDEHLSADRKAREPSGGVTRRFGLSDGAHALVRQLLEQRLAELSGQAKRLLDKLTRSSQERDDVERALAVTPEEGDIGAIVSQLKAAAQKLSMLNEEAKRRDQAIASLRADVAAAEAELQRILQDNLETDITKEDHRRMVQLTGRTRETMQEFLKRATEQKIDRLSALITEAFRFLLRKQTFIERIFVDPATFAITLYDADGHAIAKQRLSEGEKQIFAISVLWGLARASARPLPCVIDTPMARLDAAHRQHLIERYFPNASHQVVILSTDTEVDRAYYQVLQPNIARAFHLNYNEATRVTEGQEGYFWND